MPDGYQQAFLEIEGQEGDHLICWFNPKEYSVSKTNNWTVKSRVGASLPDVQFTGGNPRELTLELFFDAGDSPSKDVVAVCNRLLKMMEADTKLGRGKSGRPPKVTFGWGGVISFKAVAKSLAVKFTLFKANGTPLRAVATVSFVQIENALQLTSSSSDAKRQNPTTMGFAGLSSHTVRDGDSLQSIAFAVYGDATRWRTIAEANGIDDPLRLRRGAVLSIPGTAD